MTWDPPWPPVQINDCEWVIIRNNIAKPKAIIRRFEATWQRPTYFRVVTWAPTSEGRELVGRYPSLPEADQAVKFDLPRSVGPKAMTTEQMRPLDASVYAWPEHSAASATSRK